MTEIMEVVKVFLPRCYDLYNNDCKDDHICDFHNRILTLLKWHEDKAVEQKRQETLNQVLKIIEKYDDCPCHGSPVSCNMWQAWTEIQGLR